MRPKVAPHRPVQAIRAGIFLPCRLHLVLCYGRSRKGSDSDKPFVADTMKPHYRIFPVGVLSKKGDAPAIHIFPEYHDALLGLEGFSHINVFYWFHRNDSEEKRRILQVHPRGEASNPVTGVFATHAPVRPNLIAFSLCRILSIEENTIRIDKIDAEDETPIIDIKCYIPPSVPREAVRLPDWV
jgi:tRNA-Thr(GGU) m(6)t(6)A37 methyltransferase TsaA